MTLRHIRQLKKITNGNRINVNNNISIQLQKPRHKQKHYKCNNNMKTK